MEEVNIFLNAALKKDAKLCKFIQNTLNNGPASDSDDWDEISSNDLASLKNFGKTTIDAPVDMNQTSDPINMSSFEPTGIEDTDLTLYFAEPNELERECARAHVKRLKRELQESNKRKTEPNNQPKRLQFTGKPIEINNTVQKKPKHRRCQRKTPLVKKSGKP